NIPHQSIHSFPTRRSSEYFKNVEFIVKMKIECEEINFLLAYRLEEVSKVLMDGKKCSSILEQHRKNVQQHIHRLYRIRNSIVHAGQLQYNNTDLFIRHL